MIGFARARTLSLLAGVVICAGAPGLARSDPALYTGSVHFRLWDRAIPYGAAMSAPGLVNSEAGNEVNLSGAGPAAFALPAGQLSLMTSLIDNSPPYATLDSRGTQFTGANAAGSFFQGGAPVANGFRPLPSLPAEKFGVSFSGGPGRFGGVMNLLGRFYWRGELGACTNCFFRTAIPLGPIGGPVGGTARAVTYLGTSIYSPTIVTATVWGFPWQTGAVGAVANAGGSYSQTTTSAMGSDLRAASGLGTLQLVTPFLVRVKSHPPDCGGCENRWYYAGTATAEIRFVPEPSVNALVVAGLGLLVILSRRARVRDAEANV